MSEKIIDIIKKRGEYINKRTLNINNKPLILVVSNLDDIKIIDFLAEYNVKVDEICTIKEEGKEEKYRDYKIYPLNNILDKYGKDIHFFIPSKQETGKILSNLNDLGILNENCYFGPTRNSYTDLYEKRSTIYENEEKISMVYNYLEDDKSRETYIKILTRLCSPYIYHYEYEESDFMQYFPKTIFCPSEDEVFIDAGMRDGNTSKEFLQFVNNKYKHIYGFEADPYNYEEILNNIKNINNVSVYNYALFSKKTTLKFLSSEESRTPGSAHLSDDGDIIVNTISGDEMELQPTFIKMDIEGAEIDSLNGFKNTIQKYKPKLAICLYHSLTDWWEIPLLIKQINPEYKLYIRNHENMYCLIETVCYACI